MSLTEHEAARIVEERITYRPDATLRLDVGQDLGIPMLALVVELMVVDTYDPTGETRRRIQHRQPLTPLALESVEYLLREVRDALHRVELHESDEWLKLDGRILFDPHRDRDHHRTQLEELAR